MKTEAWQLAGEMDARITWACALRDPLLTRMLRCAVDRLEAEGMSHDRAMDLAEQFLTLRLSKLS